MNKYGKFSISEIDGKNFAKLSGDKNKIHLNNLYGYNSSFNNKICHGCLVLIKFLKLVKLQKIISRFNNYNISINFIRHFNYKDEITIVKEIKNYRYILYQNNQICAEINIIDEFLFFDEKLKLKKVDRPNLTVNKIYKKIEKITIVLCYLSKYVGVIYPGENSLIKKISINYRKQEKINNNLIKTYSKKIDRRLPIIKNKIIFRNYRIDFESLERPKLIQKFQKISLPLVKKIKSIKNNILIVGASSGIGFDVLNFLKINKNVKIIATYHKNNILIKQKNIIVKKINIEKDLKILKKIIIKYQPLTIYYFPTPKIISNQKNNNLKKVYNKFYYDIPLKIIRFSEKYKVKFFYPSTIFSKENSSYVEIKKKAERNLTKIKLKNTKLSILRVHPINTKQNLSILNVNIPNFRDILKTNKEYQKKFF
tara:strand:+ start:241 stop:1515 length:1275 start_codon:yes stop_codon:yes gene_type:complete